MLLVAVKSVPNKDKNERNSLQPNCDGFIGLEPIEKYFDHSRECCRVECPKSTSLLSGGSTLGRGFPRRIGSVSFRMPNTRFPPVFDDKEAAILIAMYEAENSTYESYS